MKAELEAVSIFPRFKDTIYGDPLLTFRDGQSRAPLVSQNVQADASIAVDVGVVDAGGEVDLGRLEWVVCWEVDCEEEDTARVWGVTL